MLDCFAGRGGTMTVPNGENAIGVRNSALMRSSDEGAINGEGISAGLCRHR